MKTQYMHFITEDKGGITLAIQRPVHDSPRYDIGVAFCSPEEGQYNRKKGRMISEGRVGAKRHGFTTYYREGEDTRPSVTRKEMIPLLRGFRPRLHGRRTNDYGPNWYPKFLEEVREKYVEGGAR